MTGSAWVYADSRPTWGSIFNNWAWTAGGFLLGLESTNGDLSINISQSDGTGIGPVRESSLLPIPLSSWQYVTFVADGTNLRLYRNAVEVGTPASYNGTIKTTLPETAIGAKCNPTCSVQEFHWDGKIDEVRLSNIARSAA